MQVYSMQEVSDKRDAKHITSFEQGSELLVKVARHEVHGQAQKRLKG
jgi:hypothetical protein